MRRISRYFRMFWTRTLFKRWYNNDGRETSPRSLSQRSHNKRYL